jgi:A/G-specific adenine glycosylase
MFEIISRLILAWYADNARSLPWRRSQDPYSIWISEIMLQQTQVETVIPYYQRWMARFPTLTDLAHSNEQEVLRFWEGLGYYSRGRNLFHAACKVMVEYDGKIPAERDILAHLPGIGPYTAAAIASIAFSLNEATLDGNIRRVLSRLFDISLIARSKECEESLWKLARQLLPHGRAGDFNQAMMDLGATLCTVHNPQCERCPVQHFCQAHNQGTQEQRPVLKPRAKIPSIIVCAAVITREGKVLIARRPSKGLLGGMWEFPGGKMKDNEDFASGLKREILEELGTVIDIGESVGIYRHAYTHFRVTLHAFYCTLDGKEPHPLEASEIRWVAPFELAGFPMGKIDRRISQRLNNGSPCL